MIRNDMTMIGDRKSTMANRLQSLPANIFLPRSAAVSSRPAAAVPQIPGDSICPSAAAGASHTTALRKMRIAESVRFRMTAPILFSLALAATLGAAQAAAATSISIEIGSEAAQVGDGRLLLFLQKVDPSVTEPPGSVDANQFFSNGNTAIARDVTGLTNGMRLRLDADDQAYPATLDRMPTGDYWVQAVLDGDHSYAYSGRGGGDVVSKVVRIKLPLYDRMTRVIDPEVAAHWRKHWDISEIIRKRWSELAPDLNGKVRVIAGEEDEAGLDEAARHLESAFKAVGGKATFTYLPGKGHGNLYSDGDERMALRRKIAWEMWNIARPESPLKDPIATKTKE